MTGTDGRSGAATTCPASSSPSALFVVTAIIWVIALTRPSDDPRGRRLQPAARPQRSRRSRPRRAGVANQHDRRRTRQARRHQDPGAQRQRAGRPGRRRWPARCTTSGSASPPRRTTLCTPTPGWSARARSGSARPGQAPRRPSGWWHRVSSCIRTSGPTTRSTWRWAPSSTRSATATSIDAMLASLRPEATDPAGSVAAAQDPQQRLLTAQGSGSSSPAPRRRRASRVRRRRPGRPPP